MAFSPYGDQSLTQPGPYDAARRPAGGSYGGPSAALGINNPRNGIVQALMQQAQPPPGLVPNNTSVNMPGMPGQGQMPQMQPAAVGSAALPTGPMGPIGGPMQPGLGLPGTMQPGQLPAGMAPQAVTGAPPLPMPPRSY